MSNDIMLYGLLGVAGLFLMVIIAYIVIMKRMNHSDVKQAMALKAGVETKSFSADILYQKLYMIYIKIPGLKRYLIKLRRRLEIINIEDEYITRKQSAKILTNALLIIIPLTFVIIMFAKNNTLLMSILLIFEIFMIETIIGGMVDKIDNKLLKQQIDFFSEIRHAYHECNMVEEAIYQVSQDDELEVSRQADKIYEVLISDDPEAELEKYYDIAPNSYLKEFAGISYLTREFGDRKDQNGASLYLKNLNNITQEMQIEILKRDKLDYVFQSLSVIAAVPMLFIEPVKNWAVSQFSFTSQFYDGKGGLIVQTLLLILTFVCYVLIRKVKDNSSTNANMKNTENPWQAKLYRNKLVKKLVNFIMPKRGTKDHRKITRLLKDAASKAKIEWLYVNRIVLAVATCLISIFVFYQLHRISVQYIYEQPTTDYNLLGQMSETDEKKAMRTTQAHNYFLNMFKGKTDTTQKQLENAMRYSKYYETATDDEITTNAETIMTKLKVVNGEYFQWFEMLLSLVFAFLGYMAPIWILMFQIRMRQLDMEDEVMQFQTIILMLMKIERVNVEIILEWLERYANIFKEPITKCVNNYEAGAWEALEELKNDVSYMQLIRIIESLQAAVEKIPIKDAFDELDTERAYYQEKRKESNERLISRKGRIGKLIGFAPMVCLFVGYLIVPLVVIGMLSMTSAFDAMSQASKAM
ncbi:MAG: hypothetical protein HFJ26_02700 [Clostridia bacterium]|nr:hypothetical protein [Clostridia bacterium]